MAQTFDVLSSFDLDAPKMGTITVGDDGICKSYDGDLEDMALDIEFMKPTLEDLAATWKNFTFAPQGSGAVSKEADLSDEEIADIEKSVVDYELTGEISKMDEEKQQVFGWAYVVHDKDGKLVIDKSGEFVDDPEELANTAYSFVIKSRAGDMDHANVQSATMIESMVFTPEKIEKMGIPPGVLPTAWWIGFHVPEKADWEEVKKRKAFSVHGRGIKKAVE